MPLNCSNPAIRSHHQHELRFRQNGDIRVVCDEDHLAALFHSLDRIYHGLKNEMIVEVVLRLIDNERVVPSRKQDREERRAFLPAGKIGCVLEVQASRSGDIQLDRNPDFDRNNLQSQRIDTLAKRIQYLARALHSEVRQLLEGVEIVGLNDLRELLWPQLHESGEDLVLISDPRALEPVRQGLRVRHVVRISHHANAHPLTRFVLKFGRDLIPHRRDLVAHQNVIGFEGLSPLQQSIQLGMKLRTLMFQCFESGHLLLERRSRASLLAGRLV
jgi:hypothetical protein